MDKLESDILEFVRERRHVSFAELQRQFPSEVGDCAITLPNFQNIVLWDGMSEQLAAAISKLLEKKKLVPSQTQPLTYLIDGVSLKMPIAKAARNYKKLRWFPVTLDIP